MTTALLVIDLINDIAHPKGKIARSAERILKNKVIEHTNQVIKYAKNHHFPVIFVKVGFHVGYPECPKDSPIFGPAAVHGALLLGSWGTEFHEDLDVAPTDLVVTKHRVSCFYVTPLETILDAQGIKTLILTGTSTDWAIEHTTRDAHDRGYQVVIVQDACETANEPAHKASLETMGRIAKVVTTETLLKGI